MAMSMPDFDGPRTTEAPSNSGSSGTTARLRVEQGSVDEPMIGLDRPITIIGRRQGSDIVIHDTNVSRMHAQIRRDGSRLTIEDAGSANGTLVNDERIENSQDLQPGDVIRIGDAVFVLEQEDVQMDLPSDMQPEGSTMAIEFDSPMTGMIGAPDLSSPAMMVPRQPSPLTPPPGIMSTSDHTELPESALYEEELSPPVVSAASAPEPVAVAPVAPSSPPWSESVSPPAEVSSASGVPVPAASLSATSGATSDTLASLRRELVDVGSDLTGFSGTLGGLADRVERLERALDEATSELASVADAIRGPDAAVLKELQGILSDIERAGDGSTLDDALLVLEQLSAQPRDIELLLKLSQQAGAIESALRIHGRLVAAAPRLGTTLARLTG